MVSVLLSRVMCCPFQTNRLLRLEQSHRQLWIRIAQLPLAQAEIRGRSQLHTKRRSGIRRHFIFSIFKHLRANVFRVCVIFFFISVLLALNMRVVNYVENK